REDEVDWHATTILSVRRGGRVALGGDGQVTLGNTILKADAVKIRKLLDGQVLAGFAGSAADGFALLDRFEEKLRDHPNNVPDRREDEVDWHATTILSVRRGGRVALGGDGQVTLGNTILKADAVKIRKLLDGQVLAGFAGSAADGFALLDRFEEKLRDHPNNV